MQIDLPNLPSSKIQLDISVLQPPFPERTFTIELITDSENQSQPQSEDEKTNSAAIAATVTIMIILVLIAAATVAYFRVERRACFAKEATTDESIEPPEPVAPPPKITVGRRDRSLSFIFPLEPRRPSSASQFTDHLIEAQECEESPSYVMLQAIEEEDNNIETSSYFSEEKEDEERYSGTEWSWVGNEPKQVGFKPNNL